MSAKKSKKNSRQAQETKQTLRQRVCSWAQYRSGCYCACLRGGLYYGIAAFLDVGVLVIYCRNYLFLQETI